MNDTEYHSKILRLPIGEIPKTHKPLMSREDMEELLTGEVFIEEKLDGTLMTYPTDDPATTVFYENLKIQHSIFYDTLPAFNIVLDIASDRVEHPSGRSVWGKTAPEIRYYNRLNPQQFSYMLPTFLAKKSAFATDSPIEGIVVKNYQKQLFGKVVNTEFYKGIQEEGSYLKRPRKLYNRLAVTDNPPQGWRRKLP